MLSKTRAKPAELEALTNFLTKWLGIEDEKILLAELQELQSK